MVQLCRILVLGVVFSALVSMGTPLGAQVEIEGPEPATLTPYVDASTASWHFVASGAPNTFATLHVAVLPGGPEGLLTSFPFSIQFDAQGKFSVNYPFESMVSTVGPFQLGVYIETTGTMGLPLYSMIHVLECVEIPTATYGVYDPPLSDWWYETPEGGTGSYQVSIATYGRTNTQTGTYDQYLFYSAPLLIWESTPGIEGLLPVN